MQAGRIDKLDAYDYKGRGFSVAFDFLKRRDLMSLPLGKLELGDGVRADIQEYDTIEPSSASFETHDRFFDIQYIVSGEEKILVCNREMLIDKTEYNAESDITLYIDPENYSEVFLERGDFLVLSPLDAHKPKCIVSESRLVRKIVLKVPAMN